MEENAVLRGDDARIGEFDPSDSAAIMALDDMTIGGYPGGVAAILNVLSPQRATVSGIRRGFGVITPNGKVITMTFVDVEATQVGTDFTVVAEEWRRCGLATAVKAASVLALLLDGQSVSAQGDRMTTSQVRLLTPRWATRSMETE